MSEQIAGRYEVLEELGRGGVGRVVLARDLQLGRKVAVKTLLKGGRNEDRARFVEEARINGQLTHPNVVTIHSLGVHEDELYMVMKLVEGKDLKKIRKALAAGDRTTKRDYGLRRLLRLYLQVCEAVGYAHARGVIHRDLKPANVMVTGDDEVLLLDWGLAKPVEEAAEESRTDNSIMEDEVIRSRLRASIATARNNAIALGTGDDASEADGELTMQGQIVGTPAYMPPEQADSSAFLDARSDVYSLGTILYELVAYRAPYTGSTYGCLKALIEGPPPRPTVAAPDNEIPREVEAIVLKAMARRREERYSNAAALADDVAAYLDGGRVSAYQETAREALTRFARQNKAAVAVAVCGFLLLNVLILLAAALVLDEERVAKAAKASAEAAQAESDRLGEEARASAALAALAGEAEARIGRALEQVSTLSEAIREDLPIAASEQHEARPRTIFRLHADLAKVVDELLEAQGRLREPWKRMAGSEADFAQVIAPLRAARTELDQLLVEGLLLRRPSLALHVLLLPDPPNVPTGVLPRPLPEVDCGSAGELLRARALFRAGREAEARAAIGRKVPSGPESVRAAHLAFQAYVEDRPLEQQLSAFDAALELNGAKAWLYLRRGSVLARLGELDRAEGDFQRAQVLTPLDAWVHGERARALSPCFADSEFLLANVKKVTEELSSEEERSGQLAWARARVWRGMGPGGLIKRWSEGKRPAEWRDAASLLLLGAKSADAAAQAKRVVERLPGDRVASGVLAAAALARGDDEEATRLAEEGLRRYPQDGLLNRVRGRVLLAKGEARQALGFLELGARSDLTSDSWRELAECRYALGKLEEGVEAAREGLRRDPIAALSYNPACRPVPCDPRLHRVLGQLRRKQGQTGVASVHFVRASSLWRTAPKARVVKALGTDDRDLLWAAEIHEELGLLQTAASFYAEAGKDPQLASEANAGLRRLGAERR